MFKKKKEEWSIWSKLVLAGLLIGVIGLLFSDVHALFSGISTLAFAVAGIALIVNVIVSIFFSNRS